MSNRFETLYKLQNNLYKENYPIVILAGSLLKDTVSGKLVIQMKFQNVSQKIIQALKIDIKAIDVTGQEVENVEYQYLDLNVRKGQFFGEDKAIIISNSVARSYKINSIKAVYIDGEICTCNEEMKMLSVPQLLDNIFNDKELVKQYRMVTNSYAKFAPVMSDDLWYCTCGTWNQDERCANCSLLRDKVFNAFNINELRQLANSRLIEENARKEAQEKEKLAKVEEERLKKVEFNKKIIKTIKIAGAIALIVVIVILISNFLYFSFWVPHENNKKYETANEYLNSGNYDSAMEIYEELGEYKDSDEKIKYCTYEKANVMLEAEQYESAIELFEGIVPYSDSDAKIEYAKKGMKYERALQILEEGLVYEEAINIFNELGDFKDSKIKYREAVENYANDYFNEKKYSEAVSIYEKYNILDDNYKKACYEAAQASIDEETFYKAIAYYNKIPDYLDSSEKIQEAEYLMEKIRIYKEANSFFEKGEFNSALEELYKLPKDYKNVSKMINICEKYKNIAGWWTCIGYYESVGTWVTDEKLVEGHKLFITVDVEGTIWVEFKSSIFKSRAILNNDILSWEGKYEFNINTKRLYYRGEYNSLYSRE